jgi:hypothetical protein
MYGTEQNRTEQKASLHFPNLILNCVTDGVGLCTWRNTKMYD